MIATTVSTKISATTRYATRQPAICPRNVIAGTPMTFAIVSPESTTAMPWPRLPGPIRDAATRAAMPKYAPCGRAAMKRATSTSSKRRRNGRRDRADREPDHEHEQQPLAREASGDHRDRRAPRRRPPRRRRRSSARRGRSPPRGCSRRDRETGHWRSAARRPSRRTRSTRCRSRRGREPAGRDARGRGQRSGRVRREGWSGHLVDPVTRAKASSGS